MAYMKDSKGRRLDSIEVPSKNEVALSPANKMLGFRAALANRATVPCDILTLGDSITEGVGIVSAPDLSYQWTNQVVAALRNKYPVSGALGALGYQGAWGSAGVNYPATTGTVTQLSNGLGHRSVTLGAGATWSLTRTCSNFKMYFKRTGTDAFSINDNGTVTPVTAGPTGEWTYSPAATSRGVHVITVTQTAGTPEIEGIFWFDGDEASGVRLWNGAKAGTKAKEWTTASGGSEAWMTAAINAAFTPSLVTIGFGTNDALTETSAAYKTAVSNLITRVRTQWPNVTILLIGSYQPPSRLTGLVEPWANYGAKLKELADADPSIVFLDLMNHIGTITTDTYGILNDTTHPNLKGTDLIAQAVSDYISPGGRNQDAVRAGQVGADGVFFDVEGTLVSRNPFNRGVYAHTGSPSGRPTTTVFYYGAGGDAVNQLGQAVAINTTQGIRAEWRTVSTTTGASNVTLTLPTSTAAQAGLSERHTFVKVDSGAGNLIIAAGGTSTINGVTTKTLAGQWSSITVVGFGGNTWAIESVVGTVS